VLAPEYKSENAGFAEKNGRFAPQLGRRGHGVPMWIQADRLSGDRLGNLPEPGFTSKSIALIGPPKAVR
jgi:hypothetical protein